MEESFLILICGVGVSLARVRDLKLQTEQSDGTLEGLGCAIDEPMLQSGGKFDTLTKTCTKLGNNWFSNPTLLANNNYFKLMEFENIVPKSDIFEPFIPPVILPGGSVTVYLETTATRRPSKFGVDVYYVNGQAPMIMEVRESYMGFNSYLNNNWGSPEATANPFSQPNTTYILDIRLMDHEAQISIDGTPFYQFSLIASLSMFRTVYIIDGENLVWKRVVFKY